MVDDLRSASDHWNEYFEHFRNQKTGLYWWEVPGVLEEINLRISGRADLDWAEYAIRKFFPKLPIPRCLSLGCGTGALERQLAGLNFFVKCDAFDISEEALQQARRLAQEKELTGINYQQGDINKLRFEGKYNAAWGYGSIHHLKELPTIFLELAASLRPHGLLVMNEYIGPSRFQFPDRQKEIVNACLQLLPERYRRIVPDPRQPMDQDKRQKIRREVGFPTETEVIREDPSESIHSDEILSALEEHFEILELTPWGGNIPQFLFSGIAANFGEDSESRRFVDMIWTIEDHLLKAGELRSDFAFIVARSR